MVHKSSHPLFLWESNFQFNFLSCETGVTVFTNSFRPPGASCAAATLLSSWKVFSVIPGHISSFLSSAVPPPALAHAAFQARHLWHPTGDVLGTFVEVEENKITFSLPPEGSFINFPMIHPILHINGFRLLVSITAFCRQ